MIENKILKVASNFQTEGQLTGAEAYGSGHIHETYRLTNKNKVLPDYLLQKLNTHVFKDIEQLCSNIQTVTSHLRGKIAKIPGSNTAKEVLTLIPTFEGQYFYECPEGDFWRMYLFLKNTKSYDLVESRKQAFEGGRGYGLFLTLLSDLNPNLLYEVLPDFHNMEYRMDQLNKVIEKDPVKRVKDVGDEIEFFKEKIDRLMIIRKMGQAGQLPLRITHNDTKFNNVLLNRNNRAQCVIDLDTVMPGYVAFDFGDAIRTIVNTADEDEKDLEKISVNMELFEGFAEGFIREAIAMLNENELDSLAHGCLLLPFIMGTRFLTDYIDGDNYYRTHFPGHNLQRARAQFRLVERLEEQFQKMQDIIHQVSTTEKSKLETK